MEREKEGRGKKPQLLGEIVLHIVVIPVVFPLVAVALILVVLVPILKREGKCQQNAREEQSFQSFHTLNTSIFVQFFKKSKTSLCRLSNCSSLLGDPIVRIIGILQHTFSDKLLELIILFQSAQGGNFRCLLWRSWLGCGLRVGLGS